MKKLIMAVAAYHTAVGRRAAVAMMCACAAVGAMADAGVERKVVYVATTGADAEGRGGSDAPYASIKYAIDSNAAPLDVMVADGTYDLLTTEFAVLADDIRVIGESRDATIVSGQAQQGPRGVFTLSHPSARVQGLTVTIKKLFPMSTTVGSAFDIASGTVSNVLVSSCGAAGGNYGVVKLRNADAVFCDSVISGCRLWSNAACLLSVSAGLVERVRITGSSTGYSNNKGCGVYLDGEGAVVRNCLVDSANLTGSFSTGCPAAYVVKGLLENCTIVNNYVNGSPNTGLYVASADATVRNCIVTGNRGADSKTINVAAADPDFLGCITHSCSPDLPVGIGDNITLDPGFADAANGDWSLLGTSVCINRGLDTDATLDFVRNPRKYNGSLPDMGCYEYQGEPESTDLLVAFAPTEPYGMNELDTTFIAILSGVRGEVDYEWDFGDGSQAVRTDVPTVGHHYSAPGEYTVVLSCDDGFNTGVCTNTCIYVNSDAPVRYVNAGSANPKFPYTTPETACRDFDTVWQLTPAPEEIHVAAGTYIVEPSKQVYVLNRAVKVIGDSPDTVRFYMNQPSTGGSKSIFTLNHENAFLAGVSLECKNNLLSFGAASGLEIFGGTASNVLVYACGSDKDGAVRLRGPDARLVDSQVRNCKLWSGSAGILMITEGLADRVTLGSCSGTYGNTTSTALLLNGTNAVCRNCLLVGNSDSGGAATAVKPAVRVTKGTLENCTVVGNNAGNGMNAGIYVDASADAIVRNCISVGNAAAGGETTKNFMLADGASVSHCCSPDLEDGVNGNVSADPQFKTINGFEYGFRSTSPCFSAGEKLDWMKGALDYLGQPRLVNAPEIGCFESQVKGFMLMVK